jgi:hypothetical protein
LKEAYDAGILSESEYSTKKAGLLAGGQGPGTRRGNKRPSKTKPAPKLRDPSAGKGLRIAGGILSLISGVFGTGAALFTLAFGGLGAAFQASDAKTIIGFGWGGLFFSFLVIVLGSITLGVKNSALPILLIVSAILGAILGGGFVAICMVLALVGGILALCGAIQYGKSRLPDAGPF